MAQVKDIKERIKGVKNTQKITKAMKSMALIKLVKAEQRALASRPFIYAISDMATHLDCESSYFTGNDSKDTLFVIFTSDRGLCGAFNEALLREAERQIAEKKKHGEVKLILVGTKAAVHFAKKQYPIFSHYSHLPADPTVSLSNLVTNDVKKLFGENSVGAVYLIYNNFKSKIKYEIKIKKLLPIDTFSVSRKMKPAFIYEPDQDTVIEAVVRMYMELTMFHAFLDLYASEYAARLIAMTKATDSADEMISALTLELNKTRQADITRELLEVISGAEALV
jgi:F-type H+-transporting ATPase subunit gamma